MGKYYITNGTQYIGENGAVVDTPKLARRFTYGGAQSYLAKALKNDKEWGYRRYFLSGGKYVMTTSTLFATANGNVTKDINTAKSFKSPADATNYLKNHRTITEYIPSPVIVDSNHEFVTRPEIKQFTPEQLAVCRDYLYVGGSMLNAEHIFKFPCVIIYTVFLGVVT